MEKTDADLQLQRAVIENETGQHANTTERVGDMFEDIIDSKVNVANTANNVADPTNDQDVATKKYVDDNAGGGAVDSVNGETGVVVIDAADVGLGNVDNTSDADKPVSDATQIAIDAVQAETDALELVVADMVDDLDWVMVQSFKSLHKY